MDYSTISVRIDKKNKQAFDKFCDDVGMTTSTAISIFIKTVLRENRIPFDITNDPFYSKSNMQHLIRGITAIEQGQGKEHNLIDE